MNLHRLSTPILRVCAGFLLLAPFLKGEAAFDFESLRYKARQLAAKPWVARPSPVPNWLQYPAFSYDEYREIRFNEGETRWRPEGLPFQLQFFHPGFIHNRTVSVAELRSGRERRMDFNPSLFSYGRTKLAGEVPADMGFSGFKVLTPLNRPEKLDELAVFQGASYFRALCQRAVYGLSARGLAIDTAEPGGEEFPVFEEFWVEKPSPEATSLSIYALLDSPSVAGAYRFVVTPGAVTVMHVKCVLFLRKPVRVLGVAPLTSMFWHGENSLNHHGDFRPEVHDSDGLQISYGGGEWLWRPLNNPNTLANAWFADEGLRGFGLLQRDRKFSSYEDLEANYHQRPSVWVQTIGAWGRGHVRLVEIPTDNETNDNIVAFWQPETLAAPGEPMTFEYRLHWALDQLHPPAGYAVATRTGHSKTHQPELRRFQVDFDGPYLHNQGDDPSIEAVVTVGAGGELAHQTVQRNPHSKTWRASFAMRPDGSGKPVELRCFLRKGAHILTETWSYRWNP